MSICSPKVAVIYDTENRWALEDAAGPRNQGLFYKETVEKSYRAFRRLGLDVDVIDETHFSVRLKKQTKQAIPLKLLKSLLKSTVSKLTSYQ